MNVAIFGLGYIGFTSACCIASEGNKVIGLDVNTDKVKSINDGQIPFEEPGLDELFKKSYESNLIKATTDIDDAVENAELIIVCVGTPSGSDGSHDMRFIIEVSRQIAKSIEKFNRNISILYRSTMQPGSMKNIIMPIFKNILGKNIQNIELVYNPEFLREANAINDYFNPSKIVVGTSDGMPSMKVENLYKNLTAKVFVTSYEEAEITKFIDNSWHATKVAFANEVGRICNTLDISAKTVHEIFISDDKLNISPYYLRPGGAFGGSCLPKDTRALQHIAKNNSIDTELINSLLESNESHKKFHYNNIKSKIKNCKNILMVGLAFKADTDDLRESPNVDLLKNLIKDNVNLKVYDPFISISKLMGQNLSHIITNVPKVHQTLISKKEAEETSWDLLIVSNKTYKNLKLKYDKIISTDEID